MSMFSPPCAKQDLAVRPGEPGGGARSASGCEFISELLRGGLLIAKVTKPQRMTPWSVLPKHEGTLLLVLVRFR